MEQKLSFKVLHPIGLDGRRERGDIIELTQAVADNYPGLLERVGEVVAEAPVAETPLEKMSLPQLVEKAGSLGLATDGRKAEVLERIKLFLESSTDAPKGDEVKQGETVDANVGNEPVAEADTTAAAAPANTEATAS